MQWRRIIDADGAESVESPNGQTRHGGTMIGQDAFNRIRSAGHGDTPIRPLHHLRPPQRLGRPALGSRR